MLDAELLTGIRCEGGGRRTDGLKEERLAGP